MSMDNKQEYLRHAEVCIKLAGSATDRLSRTQLREMAAAWLKLVEDEPQTQFDGIDLSRPSPDGPSAGAR
jgi:hypothetical protein